MHDVINTCNKMVWLRSTKQCHEMGGRGQTHMYRGKRHVTKRVGWDQKRIYKVKHKCQETGWMGPTTNVERQKQRSRNGLDEAKHNCYEAGWTRERQNACWQTQTSWNRLLAANSWIGSSSTCIRSKTHVLEWAGGGHAINKCIK